MSSRDERGQSTVEFALIIPLVLVALLAVVQVAVVAYSQLAVTHLAREAARAVAVDPTVDVNALVEERALLEAQDIAIEVAIEQAGSLDREFVVVTVSYNVAPVSGIFGPLEGHLDVTAQVKMLREP